MGEELEDCRGRIVGSSESDSYQRTWCCSWFALSEVWQGYLVLLRRAQLIIGLGMLKAMIMRGILAATFKEVTFPGGQIDDFNSSWTELDSDIQQKYERMADRCITTLNDPPKKT